MKITYDNKGHIIIIDDNGNTKGRIHTFGDYVSEKEENEELKYTDSNIRKLLKMYGASYKEIDKFMKDLKEIETKEK